MRAHLAPLSLALLLAACAPLGAVEPGCGNGVIEPERGETCDSPEASCGQPSGPAACKRLCAQDNDCPFGYACGADGVCRAPTGTLTLAQTVDHGFLRLTATDLDGDGRADVAGIRTPESDVEGPAIEVLFSQPAGFFSPAELGRTPVPVDVLPADVDGDGFADLITSAGYGLDVRRGRPDRDLAPDLLFLQRGQDFTPTPPLQAPSAAGLLVLTADVVPELGVAVRDGAALRVYDGAELQRFCADGAGSVDPRGLASIDLLSSGGVSAVGQPVIAYTEDGGAAVKKMLPSQGACATALVASLPPTHAATGKVFGVRLKAAVGAPDAALVVPSRKKLGDTPDAPFLVRATALNAADPGFTVSQLDAGFPKADLLAVGDLGQDGTVDAVGTSGIVVCTKNAALQKDTCSTVVAFDGDPAVEAFVLDGFDVGLPDVLVRHASGTVRYFNATGPKTFSQKAIASNALAVGTTDLNADGFPDVVVGVGAGDDRRLLTAQGDPSGFPGELRAIGRLGAAPLQILGNLEVYPDGFSDLAVALDNGSPVFDLCLGLSLGAGITSPWVAVAPDPVAVKLHFPFAAAPGVLGGQRFVASIGATTILPELDPGLKVVLGNVSESNGLQLTQTGLPVDAQAEGPGITDTLDLSSAVDTLLGFHALSLPYGEDVGAVFVFPDAGRIHLRGVTGGGAAGLELHVASVELELVDAAAGDLDGNETPELVVLARKTEGDGSFTSRLLVFGDVAVADWLSGTAETLEPTHEVDLGGGTDPRVVAVLDLDGDPAYREVLVNGRYDPTAPNLRALQVTGIGVGEPAVSDYYPLPWGATDMAVGDFDADGIEDLAVSNADPDKGYDYAAIYLGTFQ